jgi:hypothetical protein
MWDLKPFNIYTPCFQEKNIFLMWDLKPFCIYTLCSQEKSYVFSTWNLKPISIYTLCFQEKNYFFNMEFEALSYKYSMFTRKKIMFF